MTDQIHRRDFLKTAGTQAGLLAVGATSLGAATPAEPAPAPTPGAWTSAPAINGKTYDIFGEGGARKAAEELNIPFLGDVPITMSIREHGDAGTTSNNFADPQVAPYLEKICATLVRNLARQRAVAPPMASLPVL